MTIVACRNMDQSSISLLHWLMTTSTSRLASFLSQFTRAGVLVHWLLLPLETWLSGTIISRWLKVSLLSNVACVPLAHMYLGISFALLFNAYVQLTLSTCVAVHFFCCICAIFLYWFAKICNEQICFQAPRLISCWCFSSLRFIESSCWICCLHMIIVIVCILLYCWNEL